MNGKQLRLYAITDRSWLHGDTLESQVEQAIKGGVTMVQFREKEMEDKTLLIEAKKVQIVCKRYQVPFIINDNVKLAKEINADGVHLGEGDLSIKEARKILGAEKIIGATAKTIERALSAQEEGADYLGCGAIFGSNTKKDAKVMTISFLQEICRAVKIPVVAIGGITIENVEQLKGTGIAGVAVISGLFAQKNIEYSAKKMRECSKFCSSNQKRKYENWTDRKVEKSENSVDDCRK